MALNRVSCLIKRSGIFKLNFSTSFSLSSRWRIEQGLHYCPRRYSPLSRLPDYSFVDGRPTPLSFNQKRKLDIQKKYCERITELCNEIDIGLQKYHESQKEMKQNQEKILKSKLKPKGSALLKYHQKKKLTLDSE